MPKTIVTDEMTKTPYLPDDKPPLFPCPCGYEPAIYEVCRIAQPSLDWWIVECESCGQTTDTCVSEMAAVLAWNTPILHSYLMDKCTDR